MTYWKIELTWHDFDKREDRKFREVVNADSFDAAREDAKRKAINLGLFKETTNFVTEGQAFNDAELYDIRQATKDFLKNRFLPFGKAGG